jgi:hypothetical protein
VPVSELPAATSPKPAMANSWESKTGKSMAHLDGMFHGGRLATYEETFA